MTTLWMGDLDSYMDEQFVRGALASSGHAAVNVKAIISKMTGAPAGYCFVEFTSTQKAEDALNKLNGLAVPGTNPAKRFKLNWASYGKENMTHGPEFSIFVGDLTEDVSDSTLMDFFRNRYPTCKAAKVVVDSGGISRGYGFVRFGNESEQKRSMSEMQGARGCGGKAIRVSVATPKKPSSSSSSTNTASYTNQQYLQQYQQYQQYLAVWQASYQQQAAQYYNPVYAQYGIMPYQYQDEQSTSLMQNIAANNYLQNYDEIVSDQVAEDPDASIDVAAENRNLIMREEGLFLELDESRWRPVESVTDRPGSLVG